MSDAQDYRIVIDLGGASGKGVVVASNHRTFKQGDVMDWGKIQLATRQGYQVTLTRHAHHDTVHPGGTPAATDH